MWICESPPELAWLILVSAIEAAAEAWRGGKGMSSTKKFSSFILDFVPGPPPERPGELGQFQWTKAELQRGLARIYSIVQGPFMVAAVIQRQCVWGLP